MICASLKPENMKRTARWYLSIVAILSIFGMGSNKAFASAGPFFLKGANQQITLCTRDASVDLDTFLTTLHFSSGDTLTWIATSGPMHGSLDGFTYASVVTSDTMIPVGLAYMPTLGYIGNDTFNIQVSGGGNLHQTTIVVSVRPNPSLVTSTADLAVCNGNSFEFYPVASIPGTTFSWKRSAISGISTAVASGTDTIIETLNNTTTATIAVPYTYILTNNGCADTVHFTVNNHPIPTLSSAVSGIRACSDQPFTYIHTSATAGTTFSWSRDSVANIVNAAATGLDTIRETLISLHTDSVVVTYADTLRANGCMNVDYVQVSVFPSPALTTTLTPAAICDGEMFNYIPLATIGDSVLGWTRDSIAGLTNSAASGTNDVVETLHNNTINPVAALYSYTTLHPLGCTRTEIVSVTVKPTPRLTGSLSGSICDNAPYSRTLRSAVTGTVSYWHRDSVSGIRNSADNGVDNISERLDNTTVSSILVLYIDSMVASGCMNIDTITLIVHPTPRLIRNTNDSVCDRFAYNFRFESATPSTAHHWRRDSVNGIMNAASTGLDTVNETLHNTTDSTVLVIYHDTLMANGCSFIEQHRLKVFPTPNLSSTTTPAAVCDSVLFQYIPTSGTRGTTYVWNRNAVTGILNTTNSGADTIREYLDNNNANSVSTAYTYTLTANGCSNIINLPLTVHPKPLLNSSLSLTPVCDSILFTYLPSSLTAGATFSWTRNEVPGIVNITRSNIGLITEYLDNDTVFQAITTYAITTTANGCSYTQNLNVTVNPTPKLTSALSASRCSGASFTYVPSSLTPTTAFTWARASVTGITPATNSGVNNINETLNNSTLGIINVPYQYTLTAYGCSNVQNVTLSVLPLAPKPSITIRPNDTVCLNTNNQNVGASIGTPTGMTYAWEARNATVWASGVNKMHAIINFNLPGRAAVILKAFFTGTPACITQDTISVFVKNSVAPEATIWYYQNKFACIPAEFEGYQWGYDDKFLLDSTLLPGEVNQDYINATPDVNRLYWVIVTNGDCKQKIYYNMPLAITDINASVASINVYPNPASDNINISLDGNISTPVDMVITDITGKLVGTLHTMSASNNVAIGTWAKGVYIITASQNGNKLSSTRFIKN